MVGRHLEKGEQRKKDMLVRASQLEVEKSYSTYLEGGQTGDSSATSEAAALRRTAWREKENTPVRARQLEREKEREEKEELLEGAQVGGGSARSEAANLRHAA